jgi:hypothetical protein
MDLIPHKVQQVKILKEPYLAMIKEDDDSGTHTMRENKFANTFSDVNFEKL